MGDVAKDDAKAQILKRIGKYKNPPSLAALRHRLGRYCGGDRAVEELVSELMTGGQLRCTNKLFHLPQRLRAEADWLPP